MITELTGVTLNLDRLTFLFLFDDKGYRYVDCTWLLKKTNDAKVLVSV